MKNQRSIVHAVCLLLFLLSIRAAPAASFTNGSFELGEFPPAAGQAELTNGDTRLAAWTIAGNGGPIAWIFGQSPGAGLDFDPVDGTHQLTFNGGNRNPGTTLSQSFDTVVGEDYEVTFYVGRLGSGTGTVRLTASVMSSTGQQLGNLIAIPPSHGYGERQQLVFRATTATCRLVFTDTSTATISVDLALDNVAVSPLALRAAIQVSVVDVCWESLTNRTYQVQYRSDLTTNMWSDLGSPAPGDGGTVCISDSVRGQLRRFYRVVKLP